MMVICAIYSALGFSISFFFFGAIPVALASSALHQPRSTKEKLPYKVSGTYASPSLASAWSKVQYRRLQLESDGIEAEEINLRQQFLLAVNNTLPSVFGK